MNRRKLFFPAVLLAVSFSLSGCGLKLTRLSAADEDALVAYSAACVAKYNKNQLKGLTGVSEDENQDAEKKETTDQESSKKAKDNAAEKNGTDNGSADKKSAESGNDSASADSGQQAQLYSLNDALGIAGVTVTAVNSQVSDSYKSGDFVSLMPEKGKEYLVINFTASNTSGADQSLDLLSKNAVYTATVSGSNTAQNETTILLNDLSTYQGTIRNGETQNLVLLFQFDKDVLDSLTDVGLSVSVNGADYNLMIG